MKPNRNPPAILTILTAVLVLVAVSCSSSDRFERRLERLGYDWDTDRDGDYRVTVELDDGRRATVGLSSPDSSAVGWAGFRRVWSVAARIPGELPDGLAENLLSDTWSSRIAGAWADAGRTSDGRQVIVYVARVPEDATSRSLDAVIRDTAKSALDLQDALAALESR